MPVCRATFWPEDTHQVLGDEAHSVDRATAIRCQHAVYVKLEVPSVLEGRIDLCLARLDRIDASGARLEKQGHRRKTGLACTGPSERGPLIRARR